jgi:Protein of unknown function (DUF2568)
MENNGLRGLTLTVRFLCELAMLGGLAYWGSQVGEGAGAWALGVGTPVLAAMIWGVFLSPKASVPVPTAVRVTLELVLFGIAAIGLAAAGQPVLAVVLAVAAFATSLLNAEQERWIESITGVPVRTKA